MQKKLNLLICFILVSMSAFSQSITIEQMENLATQNIDKFTSFVIDEGYDFLSSKDNKVLYYYDTFETNKKKYVISRTDKSNDNNVVIMFMISDKNEYKALKTEMEKRGYEFTTSNNEESGSHIGYSKKDKDFVINVQISDGNYKFYVMATDKKLFWDKLKKG